MEEGRTLGRKVRIHNQGRLDGTGERRRVAGEGKGGREIGCGWRSDQSRNGKKYDHPRARSGGAGEGRKGNNRVARGKGRGRKGRERTGKGRDGIEDLVH